MKDYIYFGHGWDSSSTVDLSHFSNVTVISLKESCLLRESRLTDHLKLLKSAKSVSDYYSKLLGFTESTHNEMCVYSSKGPHYLAPDMVLTTNPKLGYKGSHELTGLFNISDSGSLVSAPSISTLGELLTSLGDNFSITIFACRGPLSQDQISALGSGVIVDGEKIRDFINRKNITPHDEGLTLPCTSFEEFVRLTEGDERTKEERRSEFEEYMKGLELEEQKLAEERRSAFSSSLPNRSATAWRPRRSLQRE